MKKTAIANAIALAGSVGLSSTAQAATVRSIKVEDVGSTVGGAYSPVPDGLSGGFRFSPLDPETYLGADLWTGDAGTGAILARGAANPTGSFSTGFLFAGSPFVPYTFGSGIHADITGGVLSFGSLDFGGNFAGIENDDLPPDPGTLNVNWVVDNGDGTYRVSFQWAHYIPGYYGGYNARWIIEGTASIVPPPATAYLFGSGLLGLARAARRRRNRQRQ